MHMSAFPLKLITLIVYIQLLWQITSQYNTIWYDDMEDNDAGWGARDFGFTVFGFNSGGCLSGNCLITNGGQGYDEWAWRSTDISSYSSIRLEVHISTYLLYSDSSCRVYYSYSSASDATKILIKEIDPPGTDDRYWYPDTIVDFPSSPSSDTIWIWLYSSSPTNPGNEYCVWDDAYLKGTPHTASTPQPSPNPTKRPTPHPINQPTPNPTKRPTPNPTLAQCVYISNFDDMNFNGEWESQGTYGGKNAYKKDAYWLFYTDESGSYYWGIYTSLESGDNAAVWDIGWCGQSDIGNCDNSWERNSGGTDSDVQFVKAVCGSITPQPTPNPTKGPTPNPTKKPTPNPTKKPTTPSPTQPGAIACGESSVGVYSNAGDPLIFSMRMPFAGELIFDASNSNFAIAGIDALTKLDSFLGSDSDHDGIVSLNPVVVGDYKFVLMSDSTGIYHVQIGCVSDEPTVFPTPSPTQYPTKRPSYTPVNHPITAHPTRRPSPSPTARPTSDPTKRPTPNPTKKPTAKPTTRSPTQPGTMTCGASTVGQYSNTGDQLIFEVNMPFNGELIFDASNSNFAISGVDAKTKLDTYLGSDSDKDGILSVKPAASGDYKFVMTGAAVGVYHVQIRCVSDEPTVFPTQSPTKYPTKTPNDAPVNHPTRGPIDGPSAAPVTGKPTVFPTDGPTDRPTHGPTIDKRPTRVVITSAPSAEVTVTATDSADSNDDSKGDPLSATADVRSAVYVVSGVICCCICACVMVMFYKFCLDDMKKMMDIQNEMMGLGHDHAHAPGNVVAVNSGDWTIPHAEIDVEHDLVAQWMRYTVKLPQYTEKLVNQGYETMRGIQAINSAEALARCGIKKVGHQTLILAEIVALQGTEFGTTSHGEGNRALPPGTGDDSMFEAEYVGKTTTCHRRPHDTPVLDTPMAPPPPPPMMSGMAMEDPMMPPGMAMENPMMPPGMPQ